MSALARETGVEAMSLYNQICNKDDLLDAVVDIDATLGCLRSAEFSHVQAEYIMIPLDSLVYGFHLLQRSMPLQPENYADAARTHHPAIDADRYLHFCKLGRSVAEGSYDGVNRMAFGLDCRRKH